jgi:hypothetical protein
MNDIKCTEKCLADQALYEELSGKYERLWPGYCRTCGASGVLHYTENQSPLGSGRYWPMEGTEPCEHCAGYCPRCRYEFPEPPKPPHWKQPDGITYEDFCSSELACPNCGWFWEQSESDCAPIPPECYCWEAAIPDYETRRGWLEEDLGHLKGGEDK